MDQGTAIEIGLEVMYDNIEIPDDDEIVVTQCEEIEDGWYMECNSRIFMETDDPLYALVTAPIIVHHDGSHRFVF